LPVALLIAVVIAGVVWAWDAEMSRRLLELAEAESESKDWSAALRDWRAVNRSPVASGRTHLAEARACLALDRAADAEAALVRASTAQPADPEPWLIRLEILRVEDRPLDALRVGWAAYEAVPTEARRSVLKALTLALVADTPDELARRTLALWTKGDAGDIEAQVALLRRMAVEPRDGDLTRAQRIAQLEAIVSRDPARLAAREALVLDLADAGEPERGRALLDAWPADRRDALYLRLRGRWDLDYDHKPARAAEAFQRVLSVLPHDWRTHYRLARALRILGRAQEARAEAGTVARLRETLDAHRLADRLDVALPRLETDTSARFDLADLCARAGLARLADAWRAEAANSAPSTLQPQPASH
jgi:hypothetical protein